MLIEDGKGTGKIAGVNAENRMETQSLGTTIEHHINHEHGLSFNVLIDKTATGVNDCIFYMKNESTDDICVEGLTLSVAGACEVYVQVGVVGTPVGGTDLTPVNLNLASGNIAIGTFQHGVDITGLTSGSEIERYVFRAASNSEFFNFEQDLILPNNQTMAIWNSASVAVKGTVVFNYHNSNFG